MTIKDLEREIAYARENGATDETVVSVSVVSHTVTGLPRNAAWVPTMGVAYRLGTTDMQLHIRTNCGKGKGIDGDLITYPYKR